MHKVDLYFDSTKIEGWHTLNVKENIDTICSTWSGAFPLDKISISDLTNTQSVSIRIDGLLQFYGYIEAFNVTTSEKEATIEISGRSILCDLVDSTISDNLKSELSDLDSDNYSAIGFLKEVCKRVLRDIYYPVRMNIIDLVDVNVSDTIDEEINIETGEKAYKVINDVAKKIGVTITSDTTGNIILYRPRLLNKKWSPSKVKPVYCNKTSSTNVIDTKIEYDSTDCFNFYKLVGDDGQIYESFSESTPIYNPFVLDEEADLKVTGSAIVSAVIGFDTQTVKEPIWENDDRYRPSRRTELKVSSGLSKKNLRAFLNNEMSRRVSNSFKYTAKVLSPNYFCRDYVDIQDEAAEFYGIFLVQSRFLVISPSGVKNSLVCVSSNTYTSEKAQEVLNNTEALVGPSKTPEPYSPSLGFNFEDVLDQTIAVGKKEKEAQRKAKEKKKQELFDLAQKKYKETVKRIEQEKEAKEKEEKEKKQNKIEKDEEGIEPIPKEELWRGRLY